ncbi:hypothetical protein ACFLTH_04455 [Bacteroidota bacterium]
MEKNLAQPHEDLIERIRNHTIELKKLKQDLRENEDYMKNGPYNPFKVDITKYIAGKIYIN